MICAQCKTHFCYLCSSYLEEGNPYKHYNTKKGGCYQRLWELEAGDGDDVGRGYFGGGLGGEDIPGNPYVDDTDSEFDSEEEDDTDSDDDEEEEILPPRGVAPAAVAGRGGARGGGRGRGRGGAQHQNGRAPPQRQQQQQRGNPNARGRGNNGRQAAAGAQREPVAMVRGNVRRI